MRRQFLLLASAAIAEFPRTACAASTQVLRFVPQADLAILDPILTTAGVPEATPIPSSIPSTASPDQRMALRHSPRWLQAIGWKTTAGPGG
jgi:hypothetical protein